MITKRKPSPFKVSSDQNSRPICLDLRTATGGRVAYPYSNLRVIALNGPQLEVYFDRQRFVIHGSNLEPLYEALLEKSVTSIHETPTETETENQTIITRIEMAEPDKRKPSVAGGLPGSGASVAV